MMSAEHTGHMIGEHLWALVVGVLSAVFGFVMHRHAKQVDETREALGATRDRVTTLEAQHRECERVRDRTDHRLDALDDKIDRAHGKLDTIIGQLNARPHDA